MSTGWAVRIEEQDYPAENLDMVRAWAREGRLQPSHYVFNLTLGRWMYAREAEELKGWFQASKPITMGATHVCTSCRTVGVPVTRVKGSFFIELILWLAFIIPGLIYSIWRLSSKALVCATCGQPTIIPLQSPEGQRLARRWTGDLLVRHRTVAIQLRLSSFVVCCRSVGSPA